MIRFLHTSDWQLGMTRRFFSEEAQARYTQARFDAIRTMGAVLAVAARECRIVIFTCVPERYAFIGEAAVVSL